MTLDALNTIESALGIRLPQQYADFMLNYPEELDNDNFGAPEFELLNNPERLIEENADAYVDLWGYPLNKDFFIIGNNGCGDYFLINLLNEVSVFHFSHEEQRFYKIADSLTEYVALILDNSIDQALHNERNLMPDLRDISAGSSKSSDKNADKPSLLEALIRKIFMKGK